ncbi:hypothetical protein BLGI_4698 [Brevibacillus laterosporus GI-9]|uniref:hypothetical protein n=1 Tax=Brevibacillus laterosporus TaxID=1465 RepID=UPI000240524B|nr:hypothetical protein [Brevibacillus laterosporus]CCF16729.1 hypothetical protein BLGI_4698 [Brevibacillus laterosporus GI-9]
MSKVVFVSVTQLYEYQFTADNLLMAKLLYDYGKPLEKEIHYIGEQYLDCSFFVSCLERLFSVPVQVQIEGEIKIIIKIPLDILGSEDMNTTGRFEKVNLLYAQINLELETMNDCDRFLDYVMLGHIKDTMLILEGEGYWVFFSGYFKKMIEIHRLILNFSEANQEEIKDDGRTK